MAYPNAQTSYGSTAPTVAPTGASTVAGGVTVSRANPGMSTAGPRRTPTGPPVSVGATPGAPSSWQFQGINPTDSRTGLQTFEHLSGIQGTPLTTAQQQEAAQHINYTDPTGAASITGENYNRLMQLAAQRSGGAYNPYADSAPPSTGGPDPYPTEGPLNPDPYPTATVEPAPTINAPRYQQQQFTPPTFDEMVANDPTYARRLGEGLGAMESRAAGRGMLGTGTHLRDLNTAAQDYASNEFRSFYDRRAGEYGVNAGERRFGHEADASATQTEYAPRLLSWNRQQDENATGRQMTYDRNWQRELYGRDDAYRRSRAGEDDNRYRNQDMWRYRDESESRRRFLAELGQA